MLTVKMIDGTLKLPSELVKKVQPEDEFVIVMSGDTIILKKLRPQRASEIAARARGDKPMAMGEIVAEVHRYRKSRHARRR